jgi:hypothetical protein
MSCAQPEVDAIVSLLTDRIDADVLAAGAAGCAPSGTSPSATTTSTSRRRPPTASSSATRPACSTRRPPTPFLRCSAPPASRPKPNDRGPAGGRWGINEYLGQDVHDAVLGVVGFGRIGRAVAERARDSACG